MLQSRLINGDVNALEEVYNIYSPKVHGIALKYIKDDMIAMDIVQDAFLKLWTNRVNISKVLPIEQQLFVITKNVILDSFRKRIINEKHLLQYQQSSQIMDSEKEDFDDQRLRKVYSLIAMLPYRQKEILEMVRFQGLTYNEISVKLNISRHTVSTHMSAALNFLRKNMHHS